MWMFICISRKKCILMLYMNHNWMWNLVNNILSPAIGFKLGVLRSLIIENLCQNMSCWAVWLNVRRWPCTRRAHRPDSPSFPLPCGYHPVHGPLDVKVKGMGIAPTFGYVCNFDVSQSCLFRVPIGVLIWSTGQEQEAPSPRFGYWAEQRSAREWSPGKRLVWRVFIPNLVWCS